MFFGGVTNKTYIRKQNDDQLVCACKMKKDKNSSFNIAKKLQRKLAIQAGFYDGRYKEKIVTDKKKEESKRKARKKVRLEKESD